MAKDKKKSKAQEAQMEDSKVFRFGGSADTEEEESAQTPKRRFPWWIIVIAIAVVIIIAVIFNNSQIYYDDFEVLSETATMDATRMTYLPYNNSLIKYSSEGITYLDKNGQAVWVEGYKMKQPYAVVSEEYIAVADLNGNQVYIFNTKGKVDSMEMSYNICNIDVASQGVFAIVLESESENYIELYDKNGKNIAELRTTIADSGYPLDVAISNNGEKLVTSYVSIDGIKVENSIAAYNFGEVGQNATDRLVGGFNNLDDTIVPKVEFLSNDVVCAFGDNQFIVYSMKEKPSEKSRITDFNGEVQSIFYNSRLIGIVEKASILEATEDEEEYSLYNVKVFDTNGNRRFTLPLEFAYNNIYATNDEIFIIGSSECRIYDMTGKLKFSYGFSKEVYNIVPTGNAQQYIVVFDDSTQMIKLCKKKEEAEEEQE